SRSESRAKPHAHRLHSWQWLRRPPLQPRLWSRPRIFSNVARHSRLDTPVRHENKMRTSSQWGRRKVERLPPRLTRVNHAKIRDFQRTIFLRATEPVKLRKDYCSREVRTQPFGQ